MCREKVNHLFVFIVWACIGIFSTAFGQSKPALYFSFDKVKIAENDSQKELVDKYKLKVVEFIYQVDFAPGDRFDPKLLVKSINRIIPDKDASGFVVLNWEGRAYKTFQSSKADRKLIDSYVQSFVESLSIAKHMRPNIKWGYFGLPFKNLEAEMDFDNSRRLNERILPILKASDFICPSLYLAKNRNNNYLKNNTLEVLRYGKELNKPVYGTIWHRKLRTTGDLVKPEEFRSAIKTVSTTSFNGKRIDGLFWWNEENHRIKKNISMRVSDEKTKSYNRSQFSMFSNYYIAIQDLVK